jgi:hypothetical protein
MSKEKKPFFASFLKNQIENKEELKGGVSSGGITPTYHCLDSPCTKKYPSDDDEPTSPTWDR